MSESERPRQRRAPPQPSGVGASLPQWSKWLTRWLLAAVGLFFASILAVVFLVGLALAVAYPNLPEISGLVDYRPKLPMRIYSAEGVLLSEFGEERRNFTPLSQMPKAMQDAILAIEDARFYQHGGVDFKGILRAMLAHLGEARSQGASTITMQVARNFYLSSEKTFIRKLYEILLTFKIESQLSKDQILEIYMNQIYLGHRAYGFASASEIYFGKPLKDITIAEAAMLAGLPKAPSAYNPITNPRRATIRQLYIIDRMLENGFITPAQHKSARNEPLKYRAPAEIPVHAEFVAEAVRQMIYSHYGEDAYSRGLNIYLTLRSAEQMAAYRALRKGILDYERRQTYRGPEAYVDLPRNDKDMDARIAEALDEHPDNDEIRAGVALEAGPRRVVAVLQNGESVTISGEGLRPAATGLSGKGNQSTQIRRGSVIRLVKSGKNEWFITQLPEVEGAFVSLDPRTGAVRALVGGFDYAKSKFNHVTQAWRQPGSSFKPFIYSAALEKGFTPATVINDAPLFFDADATGSQPWEPKNYDGEFGGPMSMRRGLAKSKNMVSIQILQSITPAYAQNWVTRFGFDADKHPAYLTMALGAGSVTPMQMASAYGVFANNGYRISPYIISKVTDSKGQVLNQAKPQRLNESTRTIDERNSFIMTSLLQEVTRSGTAARAQATLKRPDVYGKTGTTNESMDAWFAGFNHAVVAVVWIGHDNPRKLGDRETGGGLALPVWIDYMSQALKDVPVEEPTTPEGVVNLAGEWYYEEFAHSNEKPLGLDTLPSGPTEEEKKSILDLFKR